MNGLYDIKIEYKDETIYTGILLENNYTFIIDTLLSDAKKRLLNNNIDDVVTSTVLADVDFGCFDYMLIVINVYGKVSAYVGEAKISYVYTVQGNKKNLEKFKDFIAKAHKLSDTFEFFIKEESGREIYRGDKLPLVTCADKVYRDALKQYAETAKDIDLLIKRKVSVLESNYDDLHIQVKYNTFSITYVLSGQKTYLYELDNYFKGVYEDYDLMLKTGVIASATVCKSLYEVNETFDINTLDMIWFEFKMDGSLNNNYYKISSPCDIEEKARNFCKLGIPNFDKHTKFYIEYVCNESNYIIRRRARCNSLYFVHKDNPPYYYRPTSGLDMYVKVYVDGEIFITYRYFLQNRLDDM